MSYVLNGKSKTLRFGLEPLGHRGYSVCDVHYFAMSRC